MLTEVIALCSAIGVPSILSGVILLQLKKHNEKEELRVAAAKQENIVTIHFMQAIGHLAEATAENQKLGYANGKTDNALSYYAKARDDLNNYLVDHNAQANHGC